MSSLSIVYNYGSWYAMVLNTPNTYKFAGKTAEDQIVQVRRLKDAMKNGEQQIIDGMDDFFDQVTSDNAAEVVQELYGTTDSLMYQTEVIFTTENVLLSELDEAAVALAGVL